MSTLYFFFSLYKQKQKMRCTILKYPPPPVGIALMQDLPFIRELWVVSLPPPFLILIHPEHYSQNYSLTLSYSLSFLCLKIFSGFQLLHHNQFPSLPSWVPITWRLPYVHPYVSLIPHILPVPACQIVSIAQIFMKYLICLRLQARCWGFKFNFATWPLPQRNSHSRVGEMLKIRCISATYGHICMLLYTLVSFCLEYNFLYIFPVRLLQVFQDGSEVSLSF